MSIVGWQALSVLSSAPTAWNPGYLARAYEINLRLSLSPQVSEEQLKDLLSQVSEQQQKKTSIKFARRGMDDDGEGETAGHAGDSDDD